MARPVSCGQVDGETTSKNPTDDGFARFSISLNSSRTFGCLNGVGSPIVSPYPGTCHWTEFGEVRETAPALTGLFLAGPASAIPDLEGSRPERRPGQPYRPNFGLKLCQHTPRLKAVSICLTNGVQRAW